MKTVGTALVLAVVYLWSMHLAPALVPTPGTTYDSVSLTGDGTDKFPVGLNIAAGLFNAVHNTMRLLGNNWARNGFSFVPGYVPVGTPLFHGKTGKGAPRGMEWFAFDSDYSLTMMELFSTWSPDIYLYTFTNVEPLRIVNIDGASAALYPDGPMDLQGLVLNISKDQWYEVNEYERGRGLCAMGEKYGIDGFVRLNTGFELLMCSFQNPKIKMVSEIKYDLGTDVNATSDPVMSAMGELAAARSGDKKEQHLAEQSPLLAEKPHPRPPPDERHKQRRRANIWNWLVLGVERYYGDPHVVPDFRGFISAYGRDGVNVSGPVYQHRLLDAPDSLRDELVSDLNAVMSVDQPGPIDTAVNWQTVTDDIVANFIPYLTRINLTFALQEEGQVEDKAVQSEIERITYNFVKRFQSIEDNLNTNSSFERCLIAWDPILLDPFKLTTLEKRIHSAVHAITAELCGYTYDIRHWSFTELVTNQSIDSFKLRLHELIKTLDWVDFLECQTKCKADEVCFFPMWPAAKVQDEDYAIGLRCESESSLLRE